jgi:hypothetical protein
MRIVTQERRYLLLVSYMGRLRNVYNVREAPWHED